MSIPNEFQAMRVHRNADKVVSNRMETLKLEQLGEGNVIIAAEYSSVNYKDALGATGTGKIQRSFPLVPGIDVSGRVISSDDPHISVGQKVLVTGCGIGESHDGGYSEIVRVNSDWVIPLGERLSTRDAMIFGTAGFTAGLCLARMLQNGQKPEQGPIVVTGASGGVGSLAVSMLATEGFEVIAVSGKDSQVDRLKALGASQVVKPDDLDLGQRPLESVRFAGAIDNVGGSLLEGIIRHTDLWGNIASVGLAADFKFSNTVMPFILRGVSILGISSNNCPRPLREHVWQMLTNKWRPQDLESFVSREVGLTELNDVFHALLERKFSGRAIVKIS